MILPLSLLRNACSFFDVVRIRLVDTCIERLGDALGRIAPDQVAGAICRPCRGPVGKQGEGDGGHADAFHGSSWWWAFRRRNKLAAARCACLSADDYDWRPVMPRTSGFAHIDRDRPLLLVKKSPPSLAGLSSSLFRRHLSGCRGQPRAGEVEHEAIVVG